MAKWVNHASVATPRNGTTTHTVTPSSGTLATGSLFTPTAGNLLVACAQGAVTSTTPTGWTLPTGGSAVNNTGLYVWYITAAGADSLTTTHNGSNYPVMFDFYEFAAGSTFVSAASAINVAAGSAGPSLSGLTGTNLVNGNVGLGYHAGVSSTISYVWASGVEAVDYSEAYATTDGYGYSLDYLEDYASATASLTVSSWTGSGVTATPERLIFAVTVTAAVTAVPPPLVMAQRW